jgi:hypothetical protein
MTGTWSTVPVIQCGQSDLFFFDGNVNDYITRRSNWIPLRIARGDAFGNILPLNYPANNGETII